jgi:sorbose reductase
MDRGSLNGGNFIHDDVCQIEGGTVLSRFSLKGKTAIVTGAGAGIGLSVAQALAEMGANVVIWFSSNKVAHDRAADIERKYGVKWR